MLNKLVVRLSIPFDPDALHSLSAFFSPADWPLTQPMSGAFETPLPKRAELFPSKLWISKELLHNSYPGLSAERVDQTWNILSSFFHPSTSSSWILRFTTATVLTYVEAPPWHNGQRTTNIILHPLHKRRHFFRLVQRFSTFNTPGEYIFCHQWNLLNQCMIEWNQYSDVPLSLL